MTTAKIVPFLWYSKEAEEAAAFYAADAMMKMVKLDSAALEAAYAGAKA